MQGTYASIRENELKQKAFDLVYEYESKYGVSSHCVVLASMKSLDRVNRDVFESAFGFGGGPGNMSHTYGAPLGGGRMFSIAYGRKKTFRCKQKWKNSDATKL
jgi:hypothetical protein